MRVSALKDDPGFPYLKELERCNCKVLVFLDGIEQQKVETADEENGFIEKCKLDDKGHIFADGNMIAMEKVFGKVEIKLEPWPQKVE